LGTPAALPAGGEAAQEISAQPRLPKASFFPPASQYPHQWTPARSSLPTPAQPGCTCCVSGSATSRHFGTARDDQGPRRAGAVTRCRTARGQRGGRGKGKKKKEKKNKNPNNNKNKIKKKKIKQKKEKRRREAGGGEKKNRRHVSILSMWCR